MIDALNYTGRPFGVVVLGRGDCAYDARVPHALFSGSMTSFTYSANPYNLSRSVSRRGGDSSRFDPSCFNALRHS